jgi:hypothetical protein
MYFLPDTFSSPQTEIPTHFMQDLLITSGNKGVGYSKDRDGMAFYRMGLVDTHSLQA